MLIVLEKLVIDFRIWLLT